MTLPVKLYCHNGKYIWEKGTSPKMTIRTVRPTYDEDRLNRHEPIPAETELEIINCYQCLQGTFIDVEYNGQMFSIKPRHVEVIDG